MGGKKKYIEMFGSFMEPFNYFIHKPQSHNAVRHMQQSSRIAAKFCLCCFQCIVSSRLAALLYGSIQALAVGLDNMTDHFSLHDKFIKKTSQVH